MIFSLLKFFTCKDKNLGKVACHHLLCTFTHTIYSQKILGVKTKMEFVPFTLFMLNGFIQVKKRSYLKFNR